MLNMPILLDRKLRTRIRIKVLPTTALNKARIRALKSKMLHLKAKAQYRAKLRMAISQDRKLRTRIRIKVLPTTALNMTRTLILPLF